MTPKTYHSMIAGSRFEFAPKSEEEPGRTVYFVGERGQNGSYTTDDADEIKQLDKICKIHGSGISTGETPTAKEASSGIAAEILKNAAAAKAAESAATKAGLASGGRVIG